MKLPRLGAVLFVGFAAASCHRHHAKLKAPLADEAANLPSGHADASVDGQWMHLDSPESGAATDPFAGKCTIPVHQDDYYGFKIGYPASWQIDYSTDTIVVSKDEKQLEGALVFPARLRRNDIPPERLATLFAKGLARTITGRGGTFELTERRTQGKTATAVILATIDGVDLKGPLQVVEKPGFVTLKLYWAPRDVFDDEEPTLKQVLTCFERKTLITARKPVAPPGGPVTKVGFTATPAGDASPAAPVQALKPYRGRFMNISLPAGWTIQDEKETGIDVGAKEAYFGFGWFSNPQRNQDAATLLRQNITRFHPGVRILRAGPVSAPPGWTVLVAEYEGAGVHGVTRVAESRAAAMTSGWFCAADKWASLRPTLEAIAASVQITPAAVAQVNADVRQQLASYPRPAPSPSGAGAPSGSGVMSSWEAREAGQDRQNRDFDDYIRGNDRATSPSTGEEYVVPTSAWNAEGPQGAGYYRATPGGGAELLNVEPPASE